MRGKRLVFSACALVVLGVVCSVATAVDGTDAVITLGVTPLPPNCVQNPGGTATISWTIQHQTIPDHVIYTLYDPTHTIIYEQENYPGSTGITITRDWTVPSVLPQGVYWVRVEYYAQGIGLEAWAETGFLICEPTLVCCVEHACFITTELECQTMGGIWHPEWWSCQPNPCQIYTPNDPSTWGKIKGLFQ